MKAEEYLEGMDYPNSKIINIKDVYSLSDLMESYADYKHKARVKAVKEEEIEKIINNWLESRGEDTSYLAHAIKKHLLKE